MIASYEYAENKIEIIKTPLGMTTLDGPYYARVNGKNIGINSRTHWETEAAAKLAAETFVNCRG